MSAQVRAAAESADIGRVAAKLFFGVTDQWRLTDEQRAVLAGVASRSTLNNWKKRVASGGPLKLSPDTLERLSYIAGIHKALSLLFADNEHRVHWVAAPNTDFGGQSALQRMLAGQVADLAYVRKYLDAARGAQFG